MTSATQGSSTGNRPGGRRIRTGLAYAIFAAIAVIALVPISWFVYHTRTESFALTYFPGDSYASARNFPTVDERGEPRVVLVRKVGEIECFDVFYSQKLKDLLQASSSGQVRVNYRVFYRFGHPFWIETLGVAGLGIEATTSRYAVKGSRRTGNTSPGECF